MHISSTAIATAMLPLLVSQVSAVAVPVFAQPAVLETRQELGVSAGNSTLPDDADVGGSPSIAAAADTKPLRECINAKGVYTSQEANWYEVNYQTIRLAVSETTDKGKDPGKPAKAQGNRFVVDYILELLVIVGAFSDSNRNWNKEAKAISDKAWKQAQDIVHGKDKDTCGKLPVKSDDVKAPLKDKWELALPAMKKYLRDKTSDTSDTVKTIAKELGELTDDDNVEKYFMTFAEHAWVTAVFYGASQIGN